MREWLLEQLGWTSEIQAKVFASVSIVALIWIVRWLVLRVVCRHTEDIRNRYRWRKTSAYVAFFLAALLVGQTWMAGLQKLTTFLGLLSAGIAIALKDPISDLAGWAFILWRRPFGVGDRIQIGEHAGDVIDLRVFQFSLLEIGNWVDADQSTGRVINIPNGKVFTEALANYTMAFEYIWDELPVLVTFESDWEKAKGILSEVAECHAAHLKREVEEQVRAAARKFLIFYSKLTPIVYTSVRDCGVLLTLRFLVPPRRRRNIEEAMWEDILRRFAQCDDIDFAYPTQRFYNNAAEGKPGARAPGADA